ncbi:MAG: hypothetical protein R3C68_11680 [Myxococcota bacterium]
MLIGSGGKALPRLAEGAALLMPSMSFAATLVVTEELAAGTASDETTPTLGQDASTKVVVYTRRDRLPNGSFAPADIYYQRLVNGAPSGPPELVNPSSSDDRLNDVSDSHIVFTVALPPLRMSRGRSWHSISPPELSVPLPHAAMATEPRIHGTTVVWREISGSDIYIVV